ncbi:hypothetical protein A3D80_03515 [Candidatus Roizmanbacteria bacterium RIFCSPHIGHO2_02_FULL_40_13b]|uniref:DUF5659 domain-containing protein n=1 Tax=Candidatus Roizmanbacteria bacterium RIFCSPHIGHO2_01_FULL_39_24 TaxID=1802032 RepID=A0A1F7GJ17_9BACT|nr:MAG: hypothetical protein A2799_04300 [Candidatus Roizmanbacteria bacterium RIFCSPHIGHO2_01_FULL_39_24]OGK27034.1 MAG: hypothetical protein A3D80_03515 [Candidatus Roizmanbacteria bacterium RIFCSPHIGHO2_02_FULL_40_13b]OGK48811.1 MAG: hypothetical protein A3A56_01210 [Candidatus Roizmanbacteria bacterium RIFCSPLOWO2_01_FULL_40_32]OGK57299.1 MAG: hypothetical protein A3H83_00180 [Candidatus Roizmanbacteria bacterium RIFCSPLOWO2_02_FULL_39_8]
MKPDGENEYKTKDLPEVAALIMQKQAPIKMQRDGDTCWFVFLHNKKTEEVSLDYYFGNLLVNAREYYEVLRMLKGKVQPRR